MSFSDHCCGRGRRRSGIIASAGSFVALNFNFTTTDPHVSPDEHNARNLVALVSFLLVSLWWVPLYPPRWGSGRARSDEISKSGCFVAHSLPSTDGDPIEHVLARFAEALVEVHGIAGCSVTTDSTEEKVSVGELSPSTGGVAFPMSAGEERIGTITVFPSKPGALSDEAAGLIQAFAGQMSLALQGQKLAEEAREARLEADTAASRAALFSSVTHDLRTPLSSITASVTSLRMRTPSLRPRSARSVGHDSSRGGRLNDWLQT